MNDSKTTAPQHGSASVGARMVRIALVNPNTSVASTERMLTGARAALPADALLQGYTAPAGTDFIADAPSLAAAARQMEVFVPRIATSGVDAVIVSGFGDPGLAAIRRQLAIPVTGLAEAGLAEAANGGRRFSIVTVTPALYDSLRASALQYGQSGQLSSIRFTEGTMADVMRSPESLEVALLQASQRAVTEDGAQVIVIGGGPLAQATGRISAALRVPVIDPVAAAVRLAYARCKAQAR